MAPERLACDKAYSYSYTCDGSTVASWKATRYAAVCNAAVPAGLRSNLRLSSRVLFVVLLAAVVAVTRDSSTAFFLGIWRSRSILLGDPAGPAGAEVAEPPRYETTRGRASYSPQFPGEDVEAAPEWPPAPPLSAEAAAAAGAKFSRSTERRDGQFLPDIIVWAKGPLHDRLDALCAGYGVGALLSAASVATSTATEAQGDAETTSFTAGSSTADGVLPLPLELAFSANGSRSSSPRARLRRPLRVAVLWLPDPALPHSRLHHLLAPLPPLSALALETSGAAEGTSGQEGQRGQVGQPGQRGEGTGGEGAGGEGEGTPSGGDAATLLYQRPGWLDSTRYTPASVTLRIPQPASPTNNRQSSQLASSSTTSDPPRPLRLSLFLASSLAPLLPSLSSLDQSQLHTSLHRCYNLLQPSQPVQRLIAKENMTRVRQSTGVYLEPVSLSTSPSSPSASASASPSPSPSPQPTCASCPPSLLVNCTARRLMWFFLRAPHADATVAAFFPSQALAVARSFHANRQPHLLSATLRRAALCRPNPQWGEAAPPEVPPAALSVKESEKRWWVKQMVRRMLVAGEGEEEMQDARAQGSARGSGKGRPRRQSILCARLEAAELFALAQARGLIHAQHSPQADLVRAQARARGAVVVVRDVSVAPESEPMADDAEDSEQREEGMGTGRNDSVGEGGEGRGAGGEGGAGAREAASGERGRGSEGVEESAGKGWAVADGADGRVVTRRLSATDGPSDNGGGNGGAVGRGAAVGGDGMGSDAGGGDGGGGAEEWFEAERALCDAPAMKPITEHRVGQQLIVDGETTCHARFFFRLATVSRQTHRPFALSDLSHPSHLAPALSPWGALRLMLGAVVSFKEFARLVEEARRMDDLVAMDNHLTPQVRKQGDLCAGACASNEVWLWVSGVEEARRRDDLVANHLAPQVRNWEAWDVWVSEVEEARRSDDLVVTDNHLAPHVRERGSSWWCVAAVPRTFLCGLNHIKYDVVGRFEHMQQDVQAVLSTLSEPAMAEEERGGKVEDPFAAGKGVHFTNSSNRVFDMIQDKETYLRVKRIYAMDMHSTLNDLHYDPPADLAKKFEG
ncbi:unnamed protein product [Closterium sp. NIES-54]